MKNILLAFIIGIFQSTLICGQTISEKPPSTIIIFVDTIPKNSTLFLATGVVSCYATYVRNEICITRKITGNVVPYTTFGLESGEFFILGEIISINKEGKKVKLLARKYVIR